MRFGEWRHFFSFSMRRLGIFHPNPSASNQPTPRAKKYVRPLMVGIVVTLACVALNLIRNHGGLDARHFELGGEYFYIATALKNGHGFADPFGAGTGATGWMPPGFAYLLWTVCRLTEVDPKALYSESFIPSLIALKCLFLGIGAGLSWSLFQSWNSPKSYGVAFAAAWIVLAGWAQWETVTASIHDGWWVALLVTLCLYGIVRLRTGRTPLSLVLGMCLSALSSPVLYFATFLPLMVRAVTLAKKSRKYGWRIGIRPVLPAVFLSLACAGAWTLRVHAATGIWAPIKTNAGFELWQSLERTAHGIPTHSTFAFHPVNSRSLRSEYARLGERAFMENYGRAALRSLGEHPGRFFDHVVHRAMNALLCMRDERDTLVLAGAIERPVANELFNARLIVPEVRKDEWRFLFMNQSDAERRSTLALLSPAAGSCLSAAWQHYDANEAAKPLSDALGLREIALSGLITLSWIIAFRLGSPRMRRKLGPALLLYAAILTPYILVSHYNRYQELLLGLQIIALTAAAGSLIENKKEKTPPELALEHELGRPV